MAHTRFISIVLYLIGLDRLEELKLPKRITDNIEERRTITHVTKPTKGTERNRIKEKATKSIQPVPSKQLLRKAKDNSILTSTKMDTTEVESSVCQEYLDHSRKRSQIP